VIASADVMSGAWKTSERRKELLAAVPKPQSVQQRRAKCAIRNNRSSGPSLPAPPLPLKPPPPPQPRQSAPFRAPGRAGRGAACLGAAR